MNSQERDKLLYELLKYDGEGLLTFGGARMILFDVEAGFWWLQQQVEGLAGRSLAEAVLQQAGALGGASFALSFIPDSGSSNGEQRFRECLSAYQAAGFGLFEIEEMEWQSGRILVRAVDSMEAWVSRKHEPEGNQPDRPVCAYTSGVFVGFGNSLAGRTDLVCIEHQCQALGHNSCLFELLPQSTTNGASAVGLPADSVLPSQLNLLEILFDKMPMGISIFDRDLRLIRCNPSWLQQLDTYTSFSRNKVVPGISLFDLAPEAKDEMQPYVKQVLEGETVQAKAMKIISEGITSYWDAVFTPLIEKGEVIGFVEVALDITERMLSEVALEESQRRLETLMSNLPGMAYRCKCEPGWPMEFVSPGSFELTGYRPKALVSGKPLSYGDLVHPEDRATVWKEMKAALQEKRPYRLTYRINTSEGEEKWVWEQGQGVYDHSKKPHTMEGFIINITERVMAQQLLEQRVKERTREFSTILDVSHNVVSTLEIKPLMSLILEQLKTLVDYDGAAVLELGNEELKILAYQGPIPQDEVLRYQFPLYKAGANRQVILQKKPIIIPDVLGDSEMAKAFQSTAGSELNTTFGYVRSWMGIPLLVRDHVIGMITIDHHQPDFFKASHSRMALALANQAAVAIENAQLYARVRQRADESQTLLAVQKAITSRLDTHSVLQMIADEARRLTGTEQGAVYLLDDDEFIVSVISGDVEPEMVGYRIPVDGSVAGMSIKSGKPILVRDAEKDERVFGDIIRRVGAKSFVIVPLMSGNEPIGTITVANKYSRELGAEEEWVLTMLASGAVVALENANIYREEQAQRRQAERRRRVAEGLRDILAVLNSDLPLNQVLDYIVAQASNSLDSQAAVIYRIKPSDPEFFVVEAGFNMPEKFMKLGDIPVLPTEPNLSILRREPYAIPDLLSRAERIANQVSELPLTIQSWLEIIRSRFHAYLSVPLIVKDEVYGALSLYYEQKRIFNEEEIGLVVSFADQAALAIENARLRSQAASSAAATERNRLARDLHDAVTQTLFSASLIAEVLPRLWDRNEDEGRRRLQELRELTRGALAEMRTLLLELRPSALVEAETAELFRHLIEAFTGRARLPVAFSMEGDAELPAEVKVALYRITQEALNNVAKHSGASQVTVILRCLPDKVELSIVDDGIGFDPCSVSPESLGMGIMRERAESIGAKMSVSSRVDEGTRVELVLKKPAERS